MKFKVGDTIRQIHHTSSKRVIVGTKENQYKIRTLHNFTVNYWFNQEYIESCYELDVPARVYTIEECL
jgi:hypothetical protein